MVSCTGNADLKGRYKPKNTKDTFPMNFFVNSLPLPLLFQSLYMNIKKQYFKGEY